MKQIPESQQKIIDAMKQGRKLSSLLDTAPSFGMPPLLDCCASLEGQHKLSITTVKAMLRHGIISESNRWQVGDGLWHIDYQVVETA